MNHTSFDLSEKKAVVTGGGSGIGKAIAETLATHGAEVTIFDLDQSNAEKVAQSILSNEGKAHSISCDVSDETSVKNAFKQALEDQTLDILVINAGVAHVGNLSTTSSSDFDRIMSVNIKGAFYCLKYGIAHMTDKGGSIVNISSVAAHVGVPDRFAYSTSKGAIHAMTLSIAKDYVNQNIRCNSISPARIHTPFVDGFLKNNYPGKEKEMFDKLSQTQPIGRMGKPEEIGALALYLCSDEASFVTGTDFPIDGGFTTLNT